MKTIGTCSICGGPVQVPEEITPETTSTEAKCAKCGAAPESPHGPVLKMKHEASSSLDEVRKTLEAVVDRWCPKTNPKGEALKASFEQRMANALLSLNAFEIDYRRVLAGGKPLTGAVYPLPLPYPPAAGG